MTAEELWQQFRIEADDRADPPLWPFDEVVFWLSEGEEEAAVRSRLLYETANAAVCQQAVVAGTAAYPLHEKVSEIMFASFTATGDTCVEYLILVDRTELTRLNRSWRECTGTPKYLVHDENQLVLSPTPDVDGVLKIECHRMPMVMMKNDGDVPEIASRHHRQLVKWALYRAFSKPDAETIDPNRSKMAETEFENYFGLRPDAEARRRGTANTPQHNKAW